MARKTKQGHGGKRKYGKNSDKCKSYREQGRREKNKARRMAKREHKFAKNRAKRHLDDASVFFKTFC